MSKFLLHKCKWYISQIFEMSGLALFVLFIGCLMLCGFSKEKNSKSDIFVPFQWMAPSSCSLLSGCLLSFVVGRIPRKLKLDWVLLNWFSNISVVWKVVVIVVLLKKLSTCQNIIWGNTRTGILIVKIILFLHYITK